MTSVAGGDARPGVLWCTPIVLAAKIGALLGLSAAVRAVGGWSVTLFASMAVLGVAVVVATTAPSPKLALVGGGVVAALSSFAAVGSAPQCWVHGSTPALRASLG